MAKTPAWQRAEGKNPKGGLNEKGRASLRAEGHDIKRPQPEGGSRRDSFCARMKGMKAKLTSKETANDPDSRINKSLRAWNCADGGAVDPYADVQRAAKADGGVEFGDPGGRTRLSALERLKLAGQEYFGPKQEWQQLRDQVKASGMLTPNPHGQPYTEAVSNVKTMFGYPAIGQPFSYHRLNDLPMGQGVWSQTSPTQREYISPRSEAMPDKFPISKEDAAQIDQFTRHNMEGATSWRQAGEPSVMPTTPRQPMNVPMGGVTPAASTRFMETPIKTQAAIQSPTTQANINALVRPLYGDSGFTGRPVFETGVNRDVVASDPILPAAHTPSQAQIPWEQTHYDYSHKVDPSHFPTLPLREMTSSGSTSMLGHIYGTGQIDPKISDPNVERHEMQDIMNQMQGKQAMPDLPSEPIENAAPESSAPDPYEEVNRAAGGPIWNKPRPKKLGKPEHLSSKEKASAKAAAKAAGRPYPNLIDNMRAARADGGPADDRAHEFVKEQLQSGEPQVPQYVAENDFPARAARGVEAVDTAASRVNNMLANVVGQSAMRSPEGRTASEIVQSAMPVDPYQAVQQAARQWHEGDRLGAAETMAAGMPMQGAIRAYHGSPHRFDQFDLSKIGTGEGAQAYGHGLYFAENPAVAQEYRSRLAGRPEIKSLSLAGHRVGPFNNFDYSPRLSGNYENLRSSLFEDMLLDEDALVADPKAAQQLAISKLTQKIKDLPNEWPEALPDAQRLLKDISRPSGVGLRLGETPGAMYEVDIHAKPEHFLDWDRPLSEQNRHVVERFNDAVSPVRDADDAMLRELFGDKSAHASLNLFDKSHGSQAYNTFASERGGAPAVSERLREVGIPGIRYLDQGSRGSGVGSSNYVVFDPRNIEILRRYADGGEVEGDVQFLEDDPYAKVQEAAKLPMMAQNDFAMRMPQPEVRYDTGPQPGEATLKEYDPTIRERIYQGIAGTEDRPSPERAQFARGISQMAEFAPVLGNVMAGEEAQRRGDTKGMLMAALPVPGMATEARMAEAAISPAEQAAKEAYQRVLNAQGLYSHAAEAATNLPQAKGSYEQMMAMLQKAGVKPEEMRWSGVEQFAGQPVTREQLATHFQENLPQIKETVYAAPDESKLDAADAEVRRILQAHNEANNPETYQPRYYGQSTEPMAATPFFDTEEEARAHIMGMPERYRANMQILHSNPKPQVDIYETMRRLHGGEFIYNLPDKAQKAALNLLDERTALEKAAEESAPKFTDYIIPGGKNYREVLLSNPPKTLTLDEARKVLGATPNATLNQADIDYASRKAADAYKSPHWNEPNVLAHLRMSDRTGPQGEKILHMEELQSDWGQAGRKRGFKIDDPKQLENANIEFAQAKKNFGDKFDELYSKGLSEKEIENHPEFIDALSRQEEIAKKVGEINLKMKSGIPSAPYVEKTQHWVDLGLKRALKEAAEGNYNKLVWTPGEQQAERYDLSKHIDELHWNRGNLVAYDKDGNKVIQRTGMSSDELPDLVGKDVAEKLLAQESGSDGWRTLEGQDLKVGGEGMKSFYDKMVSTRLKELLKKIDPEAKIEMGGHELQTGKYQVRTPNGRVIAEYPNIKSAKAIASGKDGWTVTQEPGVKTHSITITPKMREAILKGLPAYADGGAVEDQPKQDPYEAVQQAANTQKEYKPFNVLPLREDEAGIHFDPNAGVLGGMKRAGEYFYDTMSGRKEMDPTSPEAIEAASNIAGMTTLGAGAFERPAGSLAMGASREKFPSLYSKENDLLNSIGKSKMVGDEKLLFDEGLYKAGVSSFPMNNKKSIRYLHHDEEGNPIGVLQIMTHGPRSKKATIQNVYVAEDYRRKKIASDLLKRARQDYDVKHSTDLTDQGRAFAKAVKSNGGEVVNDTDPYDNMRSLSRNFPRARRVSH